MVKVETIKAIRENIGCGLLQAKKIYEGMIETIKKDEKNQLLDKLFIQDPDGMVKNFEHKASRIEMFLDKKYSL